MGAGIVIAGNVDLWYADLYEIMALAYRLSAAIKDRVTAAKIAQQYRRIDSLLAKMFKDVHKALDEHKGSSLGTPAELQEAIQTISKLHSQVGRLLQASKRARLTNNSLTAQSLYNIANWNEEVADLLEAFELSANPEAINAIYKRSKEERERGDIFDLSEV